MIDRATGTSHEDPVLFTLIILSIGLLPARSEPAECALFGPQHDRIANAGQNALPDFRRSALTSQVLSSLTNFLSLIARFTEL